MMNHIQNTLFVIHFVNFDLVISLDDALVPNEETYSISSWKTFVHTRQI